MCTRVRGSNGNVSVRSGGCIVLDTLYTDHFNWYPRSGEQRWPYCTISATGREYLLFFYLSSLSIVNIIMANPALAAVQNQLTGAIQTQQDAPYPKWDKEKLFSDIPTSDGKLKLRKALQWLHSLARNRHNINFS